MWKAFAELRELGWLDDGARLPRMFACQAAGCAPIVEAFRLGLCSATQAVVARSLDLIGVEAPERM